jgi:hypothetical protein
LQTHTKRRETIETIEKAGKLNTEGDRERGCERHNQEGEGKKENIGRQAIKRQEKREQTTLEIKKTNNIRRQ